MEPKRILIAAIHYPIASGRYIARAFRRMGHDVKTIGPFTGLNIWGTSLPEGNEWMPNIWIHRDAYPDFVSTGFLELCDGNFIDDPEWVPDLIVSADSGYVFEHYNQTIPHVVYGVDNHVRDYHRGEVAYDHLFLAHGNGYRIGEKNVTHLPCAYDPDWHTITRQWEDREFQVGMMGVIYPQRNKLLIRLSEENKTLAGTGHIREAYRNMYNQIQVSICNSVNGDVAQRIFETAAMGCLILSDECHDFDVLGFQAWKHYIPYKTPQEAVQNVKEVLHDWEPEKVQAMRVRSMEWVKPHTWDSRCRELLRGMFNE